MDKINPGDPLRKMAAGYNKLVDAAVFHNTFQGVRPPAQATGKPFTRNPCMVKVKNLTEDDLPRGSVVQIGDYLLASDDRFIDATPWFEADVPAAPAAAKFAIVHRPILEDDIGEAFATGACIALVDVLNTSHTHATPVDGETHLESATSGPVEILSPVNGTGEQSLWVRLGAPQVAAYGGLYLSSFAFISSGDQQIEFDTALPSKRVTANTTDHQLEIGVGGDYRVTWSLIMIENADAAETTYLKIYKNGSSLGSQYFGGGTVRNTIDQWSLTTHLTLAAGDYLELFIAGPTGGGTLASNGVHFVAERIG